jgi:hypothetical protein
MLIGAALLPAAAIAAGNNAADVKREEEAKLPACSSKAREIVTSTAARLTFK